MFENTFVQFRCGTWRLWTYADDHLREQPRERQETQVEITSVREATGDAGRRQRRTHDKAHDGAQVPKRAQQARRPSEADLAEYEPVHFLYCSWCIHCVRSRGESAPHVRIEREGHSTAEIRLSHSFIGTRENQLSHLSLLLNVTLA